MRDGSSWAQVDLEIANAGPDPFHVDGLGAPATLTVTLKLARQESGRTSSSYTINGVKAKHGQIRELADFYNYEVENPCVINTQAVSASFLRDPKDAGKRYSFFLRAANLEPLKVDFMTCYEEKRHMGEILSKHAARRVYLSEQLVHAERRAVAASERLEVCPPAGFHWGSLVGGVPVGSHRRGGVRPLHLLSAAAPSSDE